MASRGRVPWLVAACVTAAGAAGVCAVLASAPGAPGTRVAQLAAPALCALALVTLLLDRFRRRTAPPRRPVAAGRAAAAAPVAAPALPERVALALELLRRALGADGVALLVPERGERGDRDALLRVAASAPAGDPHLRTGPFPATAGLAGAALRAGTVQTAVGGERPESVCPWAGPRRMLAHALASPVAVSGGRGVLVADRQGPPPFPAESAALLAAAADVLAWLDAADRAVSQALGRVAALQTIGDAAHALATAQDADDVAGRTLAAARALLPADVAVVAVREGTAADDGGGEGDRGAAGLRVAATSGAAPPPDTVFPADAGLAGRAAAVAAVLPAPGRQQDAIGPVLGEAPGWSPPPGGALAVVPLLGGDEPAGVLVVAAEGPPYDEEQRLLLRSLANLAGAELVRRRLEGSLSALARTDPLTGLANRRAFDETLAAALRRSERYGHPTSVLLLDLDWFKRVNDRHGHATGDLVLQGVARVLRSAARGVDVPARLGGEELAVVLEHTGGEGARQAAERIREKLALLPFPCADGTFRVTASVGVATGPADGADPAALLAAADAALYAAKAGGRNRVVVARSDRSGGGGR